MDLYLTKLTLSRPGFFGGWVCLLGPGGGFHPLHNFASIRAMKKILGGEIVRPKIFPLRSATRSDGVI